VVNDPVSDRPGEAFYLRDIDTGDLWSPTALPIRDATGTYVARHGRGYSRFEHVAHEIASDLLQYVPVDDPIKISRLVLTNRSSRPRRLSVTAYVEWVLGPSRSATVQSVSTGIDAATGAMFAHNPWIRALARASPSRTCAGLRPAGLAIGANSLVETARSPNPPLSRATQRSPRQSGRASIPARL